MQKKLITIISLTCLLLLALCLPLAAYADEPAEVTVLFTHDLHSHAEQYARLATLIDEQRAAHPEALLVDGGDFAMGTLLQAIYPTHGAELRLMGQMGYEAVILGNHEFDYRTDGIIDMLQAAKDSNDILPYLLFPNFNRQTTDEEALRLLAALDNFDCPEYLVVEKNGVRIAPFALMGVESRSNAPTCPLDIIDPIEYARTTVAKIKDQEEVDLIIALSHSGTNKNQKKSEDEQLALAGGYDHNFVIKGEGFREAAVLSSARNNIRMRCYTDRPAIQFYSGNFLNNEKGKRGLKYFKRAGVCLETQAFPNAVNESKFPSCELKKGEVFKSVTEYRFEDFNV
jgi:2',3'-cyclic-nucleotide 2'-phosphodiesterase (5'-nucleotidase family)